MPTNFNNERLQCEATFERSAPESYVPRLEVIAELARKYMPGIVDFRLSYPSADRLSGRPTVRVTCLITNEHSEQELARRWALFEADCSEFGQRVARNIQRLAGSLDAS